MMHEDARNLIDELKGKSVDDIREHLDQNHVTLQIAIENVERDFNMGSIVRSANAFGVRHVHVIGRRQWNKRGAMATDKYLHVHYYSEVKGFIRTMHAADTRLVGVDNVPGASEIHRTEMTDNTVLVFGSESSGISAELLAACNDVVAIRQQGSTRSMNVAAAAAIAMYEWCRPRYIDR